MAIQTSSSGSLADAQKIMLATIRWEREHNAPMRNLSTFFRLPKGHKQIDMPRFTKLDDAVAVVEGVDLVDSEDLTNTTTTLTCSIAAKKVILTEALIHQFNEDIIRMVSKKLADTVVRKIDKGGLALFDSFTTNAIGATNTNITMGYLFAAYARLIGGSDPAEPPFAVVLHPYQINDIQDALAAASGATYAIPDGFSADLLKNYYRPGLKIAGMAVFQDGNLTIDSTGDCKGAAFSKDALAYIEDWAPRVEFEKDISRFGFEYVASARYGWFELVDAYGVELYFDAETPIA